jgi:crossover junction endodeoxyribonuclease RusA
MTTLTIALSWPASALWPNHKAHFHARSPFARAARDEAYVVMLAALDGREWIDKAGTIDLTITGHKPAEHGQDRDGFIAALKPYLDGMASALHVNDRLFRPMADWGEDAPPLGRVVVEIAV